MTDLSPSERQAAEFYKLACADLVDLIRQTAEVLGPGVSAPFDLLATTLERQVDRLCAARIQEGREIAARSRVDA